MKDKFMICFIFHIWTDVSNEILLKHKDNAST